MADNDNFEEDLFADLWVLFYPRCFIHLRDIRADMVSIATMTIPPQRSLNPPLRLPLLLL
jgi:hypothetical protein